MTLPPVHLWGIDAPIEPVGGGHRNAVFRTTELKRDVVFKSTRRTEAQLRWLPPVLEVAERAGFIVPQLIETQDGRLNGDGWTCEPVIDGRPFLAEDLPQIAGHIDRFHSEVGQMDQRPGFASSRDLLTVMDGGDVDLAALPADLLALCRKAWTACDGPLGVIHGDLAAGNLLHTPDGPALLDWDEARVDVLAFDTLRTRPASATAAEKTAALAWEAACSWLIEPDHAQIVARVLKARMGA
ncbi:phosphotransferase [Celeribacter litoreus]|uniref:phosphotransferase n=1 Tax=Celeribacter litoreus TaxID=2876714 RepID=UPI001CCD9094|nr:phosphotransferase [Celeribacter litoreus]MCA0043642.1 aminoglycoside phosphotransferase family protein [Celeribacter litoreus]